MTTEATSDPLGTQDVLREEAQAIHADTLARLGIDVSALGGGDLYRALNRLDSAALCLSGGGIRSASFALGVIQALALHPRPADTDAGAQGADKVRHVAKADDCLLAKFHYLSTVSGGGYIGSWLSAWVTRIGFPAVWTDLVGRPDKSEGEPPTISWLRDYSNFLTPRLGLMSADSWAGFALYARNLILNWLVILPVLCALILVLKFLAVMLDGLTLLPYWEPQVIVAAAAVACLTAGLSFMTRNRPSNQSTAVKQPAVLPDQGMFLRRSLVWLLLGAIALTQLLGSDFFGKLFVATNAGGATQLDQARHTLQPLLSKLELAAAGGALGALLYALGWIVGCGVPRKGRWLDFVRWSAAGVAYGAWVGLGFYFYLLVPDSGPAVATVHFIDNPAVYLILGVPWVLFGHLLADIAYAGLASYQRKSEPDREWLGRAAGWVLAVAIGWFLVTFVVYAGFATMLGALASVSPDLVYNFFQRWVALIGSAAGAVTAILGASSVSAAKSNAEGRSSRLANLALTIAAPLFAVALVFGLSAALDNVLFGESLMTRHIDALGRAPGAWQRALAWIILGFALSVLVAVCASRSININRFSLHALYRNRLIRAFLGASHAAKRRPNPFTDFDETDNLRAAELWPPKELWSQTRAAGWQPFHIVNIALNVVSSKRLAWQERKATSFTVSPLHSGAANGRLERDASGDWRAPGAFRTSAAYGGEDGITLGTAMAISGAAASPNMGYHSSPPLAFLMTLLNVRLGWWLGNPAARDLRVYGGDGPRWAIAPLLEEMFGQTTDERNFIYLSDGGHFENLGLYEMVRRRCRAIVVSDAGCDPNFGFEDLGNAVRKISIDLGVAITFRKLQALRGRSAAGADIVAGPYYAVGDIDYRGTDGGENGVILYLKPGYHGTESAGVRAYAAANPTFPHESTIDQFFSESQFESYRALGFEIVDDLLNRAAVAAPGAERSLATMIQAIGELDWTPAPAPVAAAAAAAAPPLTHPRSP